MQRSSSKYLLVVLVLAAIAGAQQKAPSLKDPVPESTDNRPKLQTRPNLPAEETVNSFLQQMFGYNSALSWKVADIRPAEAEGLAEIVVVISTSQGQQVTHLYVTPDGKHALAGEIIPFGARPFADARGALEKGISGPAKGPASSPVTLVEFSDLQCPHCKDAQPVLEKLLGDEPNARLVFQSFPLSQIHDWANKGAAYADCVARSSNDAFWKFIHDVYEGQASITAANADDKLTALADQAGVKGSDIAACAAKPETVARVERSVALAKDLRVTGTPTVFINGRKIENVTGVPYDVVKQLVEFAAKDGQDQQAQAK
jgi:protein-disulfide isomerase